MACVTKAGFGYNGRVATKCPAGSYNAAGNYGTCTQCAAGLSTADDATQQVAQSNCAVAVGYGFHDGALVPCPVGTYNDALRTNATAACTPCGTGLSTSQAGGRSSQDCNVCTPGFGGASCASTCGGASATYGVAGRAVGAACDACPVMSTGFSFDYLAVNQNFTPATVARTLAASPADCLAEFAQVVDAAWYMGGAAALTNVTASAGVNNFTACVADCKGDDTCQYITFDYDAQQCFKKVVGTATTTGDVLAFKAVVAGDTTAASLKNTKGKALASGSYTFWAETASGVGADATTVGPTASLQACLSACDNDFACAAVSITGATADASAGISSCRLIKGDAMVATFKRSVTKTVATRLQVSAALP